MKILTLLIISILFMMPKLSNADIADMRFGYHKDKTRLVFDMSKHKYKISHPNSNVIKIEVYKADWLIGKKIKPKSPINAYEYHQDGKNSVIYIKSRVAIEVKDAFLIKSVLKNPAKNKTHRLVVDIRKSTGSNLKDNKVKAKKASNDNIKDNKTEPAKRLKPVERLKSNRTVNKIDMILDFQKHAITKIPSKKIASKSTFTATNGKLKRSKKLIIVDPGHGGGDPGAIAKNKVYEKNITLSIARAIKKQLEKQGKYKVILTRNSDKYIKLRDRFALARKKDADFFISIHADKLDNKMVRGASVYTLSETASDKETHKLAERENHSGVVAGIDLGHESMEVADILLDFAMRESMNQSKYFANYLVKSFNKNKVKTIRNPHRYAGFAVLKAPDIPSVLIETGFLSNPRDVRLLQDKNHQINIAKSIEYGLDKFFLNN